MLYFKYQSSWMQMRKLPICTTLAATNQFLKTVIIVQSQWESPVPFQRRYQGACDVSCQRENSEAWDVCPIHYGLYCDNEAIEKLQEYI